MMKLNSLLFGPIRKAMAEDIHCSSSIYFYFAPAINKMPGSLITNLQVHETSVVPLLVVH